jgi:hypothetical protein
MAAAAAKGLEWAQQHGDDAPQSARLDDRNAAEREMYGDDDDESATELAADAPASPEYEIEVLERALPEIVEQVSAGAVQLDALVPALADAAVTMVGDPEAVAERRGIKCTGAAWNERRSLREWAQTAGVFQVVALLVDALLTDCVCERQDPIVAVCRLAGVDLDRIAQRIVNEREEAAAAEKAEKAAKKATKKGKR